jgi:hypothetical protein
VHFVVYLYIMDLITVCIYEKQTHMHVISAYVNVFVIRLWECTRIHFQLKGLSEFQLFSSVSRLTGNCEESDYLLVNCHIVCFLSAVHLLQHREVGINSTSDLK